MEIPSLTDLRDLTRPVAGPCVTLHMPTHRAGPATRQNPLRLKNLLRAAEDRLRSEGMRPSERGKLLAPAALLLEDPVFWQHQSDGLAVFLRPGWSRTFRVPVTLPELAFVARTFHVTPLLPLLTDDGRFLVLALSQRSVRLVEGSRHRAHEVALKGMPSGLEDALRYDETEKEHLFHIAGRGGAPGARPAFHGHGIGEEIDKQRIRRYFRVVDHGLHETLRGRRDPMVLAAVEYEQAIYRETNTYPHLLEGAIGGNPEPLGAGELRDRAWALVEPLLMRRREEAIGRYGALAGTAQATNDLAEILASAEAGRIKTLFVPTDEQRWGSWDPATGKVRLRTDPRPGDVDLLDLATVRTLLSGGAVHAMPAKDLPAGPLPLAVLRF